MYDFMTLFLSAYSLILASASDSVMTGSRASGLLVRIFGGTVDLTRASKESNPIVASMFLASFMLGPTDGNDGWESSHCIERVELNGMDAVSGLIKGARTIEG